jgi:hypothetical protein
MGSGPNGQKLSGRKVIRSQGHEIIFIVYTFVKMEPGNRIGEKPYRTDMGASEGLCCCYER